MKLKVLYEDNHILIIDKKPGIPVQQDKSNALSCTDLAKAYIKEKYNKPGNVFLGPVHRIDKFVSGVLVFARTSKAASRLHQEFMSKSIQKYYVALLNKRNNKKDHWIELQNSIYYKDGYGTIDDHNNDAKTARLLYHHIESGKDHSLYLIKLITGRKHQIRIQFSHRGFPIVGDTTYGSTFKLPGNKICLHSYFTEFIHPVKKEPVQVYADIPDYILHKIDPGDTFFNKIEDLIKGDNDQS